MTNNTAILNERRLGVFANAIHKSITEDVFGNDERKRS
jgi:hypothetical protein